MRNAYLVTSGSYSDYGVSAVFSSLKAAREYIGNNGDYRIEPFTLNHPELAATGRRAWDVRITREGVILQAYGGDFRSDGLIPNLRPAFIMTPEKERPGGIVPRQLERYPNGYLDIALMASSREQAIKAVNERRTQMIASGQWPIIQR